MSSADPGGLIHASVVLQRLQDEAPADQFTLGWLVVNLRNRSYGMLMLVLALFAIVPGVSFVAGLLLMIPAFQMIAGRSAAVFPRRIAARPLSTRHLAAVVRRAVPVLRSLEKIVHPRWHTLLKAIKRFVGAVVMMLSVVLVFAPIPLGNVFSAVVIALISFAYLEEDGLLLSVALLAAVIVLTFTVWEAVLGAKWIIGLWELISGRCVQLKPEATHARI
jgi:hypothetical protein